MIPKTIKDHDELILGEYYVLAMTEPGYEDRFIIFQPQVKVDNWNKTSKDKDRISGPYLGNFDYVLKYVNHGQLWVTDARTIRPAMPDEIEWLNICKTENKLIPKHEIKKYYVRLLIDKINKELNVNVSE